MSTSWIGNESAHVSERVPLMEAPSHRQRHVGHVCQLNYEAGGSLISTALGEGKSILPFSKGPCRMMLGDRVAFSLTSRGEVVDVSLSKPLVEPGEDSSTASAFRLRKLHRSIGRFRNADLAEQLQLVANAEERLDELLSDSEWDGDAICKVVACCAGWLHAATSRAVRSGSGWSEDQHSDNMESGGNVQSRVRRLLIRGLSHLDLTHTTTCRALESALSYIRSLLPDSDYAPGRLAAKQWNQLRALLSCNPPPGPGPPEAGPRCTGGTGMLAKDKGTTSGGVYCPSEKVRRLRSVSGKHQKVEMKCRHCQQIFTSRWRWTHPGTGQVHILVPNTGHRRCTKQEGKKLVARSWQCARVLWNSGLPSP